MCQCDTDQPELTASSNSVITLFGSSCCKQQGARKGQKKRCHSVIFLSKQKNAFCFSLTFFLFLKSFLNILITRKSKGAADPLMLSCSFVVKIYVCNLMVFSWSEHFGYWYPTTEDPSIHFLPPILFRFVGLVKIKHKFSTL